jgi:hypothetical protein
MQKKTISLMVETVIRLTEEPVLLAIMNVTLFDIGIVCLSAADIPADCSDSRFQIVESF